MEALAYERFDDSRAPRQVRASQPRFGPRRASLMKGIDIVMGKPTGSWSSTLDAAHRPVPVRLKDWKEVYEPFPAEELESPGRTVHGLWDPVLQQRLPARAT